MTPVSTYLRYLAIPSGYGPTDGLRWSANGEAIETHDGRTFVLAAMLPNFLEGFAEQRPLIHFVYILDLLRLLGHTDEEMEGISRLQAVSIRDATRSSGSSVRNAGTFFGIVCEDIPSAHLPGCNSMDLAKWFAKTPVLTALSWENPENPPLNSSTFRKLVGEKLDEFSWEDIRHWFRFGRGRLPNEGERLAEEVIDVKPPAFRGTLDELIRERPRLAGALPLVGKMVSALSLPPRRRTPPELPLGGYADVTNRGEPERLLPSQFALDGDEFVRRFAEKELLFFRREEPHQRSREQLVLLVDQGVRTWGVVRLALGAAVLAFRKLAQRKKRPFFVRFGGTTERIDPDDCDLVAFADRLEVSDLSANPAELLAAEASDTELDDADIVLLTHPRSLADETVKQSACTLPENKRLFALAVDEDGSAQFSEMRHGEAVPISRFRVDFHATEVPPVHLPTDENQWTGDVEPVPYPFPVGLFQNIVALDFDADSRHLLVLTQHGYLHLWNLENGRLEMLPRAFHQGKLITLTHQVLGVRSGFVISGQLDNNFVAAHYDFERRSVKLHVMGPSVRGSVTWYAFPDLHAIAMRKVGCCCGLDLNTGTTYSETDRITAPNSPAEQAYFQALERNIPFPRIPTCLEVPELKPPRSPFLTLERDRGEIRLFIGRPAYVFRLIEDGKSVSFQGDSFHALLGGNVLAFAAKRLMESQKFTWWLFSVFTEKGLLSTYEIRDDLVSFCRLSSDGRSFAMPTERFEITVRAVGEGGTNRLVTAPGKIHNNLSVAVGKASMHIIIGKKRHVLSWKDGPLSLRYERVNKDDPFDGNRDSRGKPHVFANYSSRFVSVANGDVDVLIDAIGNIIVYDPHRNRLVCMFRVRRSQFAAWMPDGTIYGPYDLTSRHATPDALERLGAALRLASSPAEV